MSFETLFTLEIFDQKILFEIGNLNVINTIDYEKFDFNSGTMTES